MQNFIYEEISKRSINIKIKFYFVINSKENTGSKKFSALNIFKNLRRKNLRFLYDPLIDDQTSKKMKIYKSFKNFKNYDVYIPITKHKKIVYMIKKLQVKRLF